MIKNRSIAIVPQENLITKIIKSLKNILKIKQEDKDEIINRKAMVITEEKIERKMKKNITLGDLTAIDENVSKDISYIDGLDEDELDMLNEYYDSKISELENILNDKKSSYFKMVSARKI